MFAYGRGYLGRDSGGRPDACIVAYNDQTFLREVKHCGDWRCTPQVKVIQAGCDAYGRTDALPWYAHACRLLQDKLIFTSKNIDTDLYKGYMYASMSARICSSM